MTPPFVSDTWPLSIQTLSLPTMLVAPVQTRVDLPCQTGDPERFFAESPEVIEAAKLECQACPLVEACLAGALARREPHGVWGGEWFVNGDVVARKRPRGRPRKLEEVAA